MSHTDSIISNRQTQQPSLSGSSVKCILASRVFVAPINTAQPQHRVNSNPTSVWVPTTWSDMGAVMKSKVQVSYNKTYADVRSGLDGVYKLSYVTEKTAEFAFSLDNFDMPVMGMITGNTSVTVSVSGYTGQKLWIGAEDVVTRALLLVGTNKIDNKEHHYYNPAAILKFQWAEDGDAIVVAVTATLKGFDTVAKTGIDLNPDGSTLTNFYSMTVFDAAASGDN